MKNDGLDDNYNKCFIISLNSSILHLSIAPEIFKIGQAIPELWPVKVFNSGNSKILNFQNKQESAGKNTQVIHELTRGRFLMATPI
jgi:hypothetical protein